MTLHYSDMLDRERLETEAAMKEQMTTGTLHVGVRGMLSVREKMKKMLKVYYELAEVL